MMKSNRVRVLAALSPMLLAACTTIPDGPSTYALPGSGKSFERFRYDEADCRQYASSQTGGNTANDAAVNSGVASAAVGTAVGAVAGAALGGQHGAAAGAGAGLMVGALAGTGAAHASGYQLQQRYDMAYGQCMYAKGHKIPVSGSFAAAVKPQRPAPSAYPPPPSRYPPPPGYR
jgi:hypothetical protein